MNWILRHYLLKVKRNTSESFQLPNYKNKTKTKHQKKNQAKKKIKKRNQNQPTKKTPKNLLERTSIWENTYYNVFRESIQAERAIIKHDFIEKLRCHSYDSATIVSCIPVFCDNCLPNCNGLLTRFGSLEKKNLKEKVIKKYQLTHQKFISIKPELITVHSLLNIKTLNGKSFLSITQFCYTYKVSARNEKKKEYVENNKSPYLKIFLQLLPSKYSACDQ